MMHFSKIPRWLLACVQFAAIGVFVSSCSTAKLSEVNDIGVKQQIGESAVFIGEEPAQLAFLPLKKHMVDVRSTYRKDLPSTVHYEAGRDYVLDFDTGKIQRTASSRIPDFRTNMLYNVEDFDHGKFPGYGNRGFFAFIDYSYRSSKPWPWQAPQAHLLPKTREKLLSGSPVKIVAFGDSITAGGEATEPQLIFWQQWADSLQRKYPHAQIQIENGATGGDSTKEGIKRLQAKVLDQHPDLVLVGFGMNDHNVPQFGTPLGRFAENLRSIIDRIRKETGAEVILYSTFPPNPKWHYGTHNMEAYAMATAAVAHEKQCAYADVYANWTAISWKKKPEDMLSNNINHPNDFGHWIYFKTLEGLDL